ncbi:MAG: SNF2-related protein [Gemmata sp.]
MSDQVTIQLDLNSVEGYRTFLRVKSLPVYRFVGRTAVFPAEYAQQVGAANAVPGAGGYAPHPRLFDYQRDISRLAARKRKFAVFADCGLGKTFIAAEFVRHAVDQLPAGRRCLIVSPLMVVDQTVREVERFYGEPVLTKVRARDLSAWLAGDLPGRVGITNYDAITGDMTDPGLLGCLVLDESSMLKSHYGAWGQRLIALGRGLDWKLCLTGTPAPNDRIEYANHVVFLDQFPTVNSFLARFFVNRGQTNERWELKPHALKPFYKALSHWCIFLTRPSVYGWSDNTAPLPPINVHVTDVELTAEQKELAHRLTGGLYGAAAFKPGGIGSRSQWARLAKGFDPDTGAPVPSNKPGAVCDLARAARSIVWCKYNAEQDDLAARLPGAANVTGATNQADRAERIAAFLDGTMPQLVSKPEILGFGLNLQCARRQVFSTIQDSYEDYYQAVKRSNRTGSAHPLDVYIPVTDLERPMLETVLAKAKRVQADAEEQEQLFKEVGHVDF